MSGLRSRQNDHSGTRLGRRGIGQQNHLTGRKGEFGAGEQVGHSLGVVDRAVQVFKASQLASAIDAAGGMLRLGSFGLIGVDADEQGALSMRCGLRSSKNGE